MANPYHIAWGMAKDDIFQDIPEFDPQAPPSCH